MFDDTFGFKKRKFEKLDLSNEEQIDDFYLNAFSDMRGKFKNIKNRALKTMNSDEKYKLLRIAYDDNFAGITRVVNDKLKYIPKQEAGKYLNFNGAKMLSNS